MDKPTTPAGGDGAGSPWTDDAASEPGFGATGIFGTVSLHDEPAEWKPVPPPVNFAAQPPPASPAFNPAPPAFAPAPPVFTPALPAANPLPPSPPPSAFTPMPAPPQALRPLAEPVVHKVVLGGSTDESPAQLLERIRAVTAERATTEKPAAAAAPQGSAGFTELLRTLGTETPVPKFKAAPAGPTPAAAPNSGFTSLLQTLNAPTQPAQHAPSSPAPSQAAPVHSSGSPAIPLQPFEVQAAQTPHPPSPPVAAWTPVAPEPAMPAAAPVAAAALPVQPVPAAPAPGGFTELLRMSGPDSSAGAAPFASVGAASPVLDAQLGSAPPTSQPGEFTRLFGTFSESEASVPPPFAPAASSFASSAPPLPPPAEPYSGGGPGSFTRMLSLEQMSEPAAPAYREQSQPVRTDMDFGLTPAATPAAQPSFSSARSSFSSSQSGASPLTESFFQQPAEPIPQAEPTAAAGVGITKLIQMLDAPVRQEAAPLPSAAVAAPGGAGPGVWTQTFASLASTPPPTAPAATPPQQSWQPPASAVPAAPPSAGPSEFTRILDASRMREEMMKGGAGVAQSAPAAQSGVPMPQMNMPPMPQMPTYTPPPMPQAPPLAGARPTPGGFAPPQMPGGFAAPAMPSVPQPPAISAPAPPAAGKLQQMVPLLLVVAIVLLVVVLVTVIFMLKK